MVFKIQRIFADVDGVSSCVAVYEFSEGSIFADIDGVSSCVAVYEFSEGEPMTWPTYKTVLRRRPSNKVGVVLKRNVKGTYSVTLM